MQSTSAAALEVSLPEFARERHVRYSIAPERAVGSEGEIPIGFDVRLFASHAHEPHVPGACPVCRQLEANLLRIAKELAARHQDQLFVEIDPEYGQLYESREVRNTDDVVLDLRLLRQGKDDRPCGPAEERCLRSIRADLKALSVHEA